MASLDDVVNSRDELMPGAALEIVSRPETIFFCLADSALGRSVMDLQAGDFVEFSVLEKCGERKYEFEHASEQDDGAVLKVTVSHEYVRLI